MISPRYQEIWYIQRATSTGMLGMICIVLVIQNSHKTGLSVESYKAGRTGLICSHQHYTMHALEAPKELFFHIALWTLVKHCLMPQLLSLWSQKSVQNEASSSQVIQLIQLLWNSPEEMREDSEREKKKKPNPKKPPKPPCFTGEAAAAWGTLHCQDGMRLQKLAQNQSQRLLLPDGWFRQESPSGWAEQSAEAQRPLYQPSRFLPLAGLGQKRALQMCYLFPGDSCGSGSNPLYYCLPKKLP